MGALHKGNSMTVKKKDRLPKPLFRDVESLDRVRAMMLGNPVKKCNQNSPYGYEASPNNKDYWIPIDNQLRLLVKAKKAIENAVPYKEIAEWLTVHAGRKISAQALYNIMHLRCPDDRILLSQDERASI